MLFILNSTANKKRHKSSVRVNSLCFNTDDINTSLKQCWKRNQTKTDYVQYFVIMICISESR